MPIKIKKPYLLFVGDVEDPQTYGKTAAGIYHWCPQDCVGQLRTSPTAMQLPGLPELSIEQAVAAGAKTLIVGVANIGGTINADWVELFQKALSHKLDIASGLHEKVSDIPGLQDLARLNGCSLYDVRHTRERFPYGDGAKRSGKRLLTIGTDCAVGKMFTALSITKELHNRGMDATFRATGQTGIFIAGEGIPFDALAVDFACGAVESLSPNNREDHWDIIEGQASILHPVCGTSLGLLHGSQPDAMVLCHVPTRQFLSGTRYPMPTTFQYHIEFYEAAARLTNPKAKVIAMSINTSKLDHPMKYLEGLEKSVNMPCVDPLLTGVSRIADVMQRNI